MTKLKYPAQYVLVMKWALLDSKVADETIDIQDRYRRARYLEDEQAFWVIP